MSLYLKNYQKNNILRRCFIYQNVYEFAKIKKTTISFTINNTILFKTLLKIATFLELITNQRSFFIRTKKSLVTRKIR
jgi:ribosomal protein L5